MSQNGRNFNEIYVNLQSNVTALQTQAENDVKDLLSDVQDSIDATANDDHPDVGEIPGIEDVLEKWEQGQTLIQNGNLTINFNNPKLQEHTELIEQTVNSAVK